MYTVQFVANTRLVGAVFTLFDPDGAPLASTDQGYTRRWLQDQADGLNRARLLRLNAAAAAA